MISKGRILRLLRESLNLRQDFVATKAEISPGYLSLIEKGKREPNNEVLYKLADIYKVPFYLLVWNEKDIERTKNEQERDLIKGINNCIEQLFLLVMGRNGEKTLSEDKKAIAL